MATVWVVTIGDQERNFRRLRDAVAWLLRLTRDMRPGPHVQRQHADRYRYYGPGEDVRVVTCAVIDRLRFPPRRFYLPRSRVRTKRPPELLAVDAVRLSTDEPLVLQRA
jgi:hypothetical protein